MILIGTESHLDESHSNSEIFPRNTKKTCGGFISVKSTVPSYQIDIGPTSIEIIWAYLHIGKSGTIVGSFYGPPHFPDLLLGDLLLSIATIKYKFPHAQIILGGEFNCFGIDWDTYVSHM